MRGGLDAPTEKAPAEVVARMREFLERQRPIALAVWVRHEQQGLDEPLYDHHTMLGVRDELYIETDLWALECGLGLECRVPGWLDLFPLAEVEQLRAFGDVLWERHATPDGELDPLDFRFTWEPLDVPRAAANTFRDLVDGVPGVRRVDACSELLWKNGRKVSVKPHFWADFAERRPGDWEELEQALDESGVRPRARSSVSAGLPWDERIRTAVLYER